MIFFIILTNKDLNEKLTTRKWGVPMNIINYEAKVYGLMGVL